MVVLVVILGLAPLVLIPTFALSFIEAAAVVAFVNPTPAPDLLKNAASKGTVGDESNTCLYEPTAVLPVRIT
jgi:hypothetical protein